MKDPSGDVAVVDRVGEPRVDPAVGLQQRVVGLKQRRQLAQQQPVGAAAAVGGHQIVVIGAQRRPAGESLHARLVHGQRGEQVLRAIHAQAAVVHDVGRKRLPGARDFTLDVERSVRSEKHQDLRGRVIEPDIGELRQQRRRQRPQQSLFDELGVHPLDEYAAVMQMALRVRHELTGKQVRGACRPRM